VQADTASLAVQVAELELELCLLVMILVILTHCPISLILIHVSVPVYDARTDAKNFYNVLPDLDGLDRFHGDVPVGSCVVVAYTINTWGKDKPGLLNVSFNVKWVMLLCTSDQYMWVF
jgi:hypothetical protein